MQNGVSSERARENSQHGGPTMDCVGAVLLAEEAVVQSLDLRLEGVESLGSLELPRGGRNAFGDPVVVPAALGGAARVRRAAAEVASGHRVGFLSSTRELVGSTDVLREMAAKRLGTVFHLLEPQGAEMALALADLGWGMLFAGGVAESFDLALVARRAAEDSGTPFFVVHDVARPRRSEGVAHLDAELVHEFVGHPSVHLLPITNVGHSSHAPGGSRAFAERVPFALASGLRDIEAFTGRKRDVLTRTNHAQTGRGGDASLMLVGLGALGDALLEGIPRLRAQGHDVGAVKVTAFRPFDGPRAVRLLARSLALMVLEHTDEPFAQSNPLTREIKAGFSDALTWAPDYPGVGRIPRIHSGVARAAVHVEAHDLDSIVRNMLAGEGGKRSFVLGGEAPHALDPAAQPPTATP